MSRHITKGVAEAIFNAFGNGGRVLLRRGTAEGAPADFQGINGSIRPFSNTDWDGHHFCAEDWHVILAAWFDGGNRTYTRQQFQAIADRTTINFRLDGDPLTTTRTTTKRFLNPEQFGFEEAYYFQQGRIMSPDDLSVGQHQLAYTASEDGQLVDQDSITFFIDAPNAGACLG
jgi:hypothetical protein